MCTRPLLIWRLEPLKSAAWQNVLAELPPGIGYRPGVDDSALFVSGK